jgi:RNA polymerase sigma-70 factor (ECF subfamily)
MGRVPVLSFGAVDSDETTRLVRDAKAGSPEAIERLYERLAPRLLAFIRLRLGRTLRAHLESRDILQAALLRSFERLPQLEGTGAGEMMAWLTRIAENEIRDRADYHQRQRRDAARDVPLDEAHQAIAADLRSMSSRIVLDEEAARLERAIERLTDDHREVILLRKFEELGYREIAARLGRSEDACRMLLARAMAALTVAMTEDTP